MTASEALTRRWDLASELVGRPPVAGSGLTPSASAATDVDQVKLLEALTGRFPIAGTAGVDIDKELRQPLPAKVRSDLTLSSVACCRHEAGPTLAGAEFIRGRPASSDITTDITRPPPASHGEALDISNVGTVQHLLSSWNPESDPLSRPWKQGFQVAEADRMLNTRSIRKLPNPRASIPGRHGLPSSIPSPLQPSVSAIPVVLPRAASSPARRSASPQSHVPLPENNVQFPLAVAQTQIEPGAYGSRIQSKKKATSKRRQGGF